MRSVGRMQNLTSSLLLSDQLSDQLDRTHSR
jgi:hypothetical protein